MSSQGSLEWKGNQKILHHHTPFAIFKKEVQSHQEKIEINSQVLKDVESSGITKITRGLEKN